MKCKGNIRKIWSNINSWSGRGKTNVNKIIMKYLGKKT